MDPKETYRLFLKAVSEGRKQDATEAYENLRVWLERGGFEPDWSASQRARFFLYNPKSGYIEAGHRGFVLCRGCIRRGCERPNPVKPGFNCNDCADIEEGAY
jgi:hypothetical protein